MNEGNNNARVGRITRRIVDGAAPPRSEAEAHRALSLAQLQRAHEAGILQRERAAAGRERLTLGGVAILVVYGLSVVGLVTVLWLGAALFNRAFGAETWLVISTASWHPDRAYERDRNLNSVNPGLGIERAISENLRLAGGAYVNSYRRTSVYAAAAWLPLRVLGARSGITGGAVSGYPYYEGGVGPFAAALVAFEGARVGANLVLLPRVGDKSHGAVALQLKVRL